VRKKPIVDFPVFGAFSSDRTPKTTKISTYTSLFTVTIPVNYGSEFREHSEAATYILITVN
jgi:hypothetical protein